MAESIRGINVQIGSDTTGLAKALGDVNKNARDIQSELKQVERLLKLDPNNTELLAQKQKLLADAVENTQEKLNRLKSVQEQVNEQFARGEISEGQYRAFQREVAKTEQELQKLQSRLKDTGFDFDKLGESVTKAGQKMTDAGKKLSTRVTAPLAALGGVALKAGIDFEAAMSEVAAISGATGDDLTKLTEKAKEMGATTKFSASEAADALKYMAMAGWDTNQMLDGLDGVMMLAAASGEQLGTVSDIVTDSMTAFGLAANQAGQFADVLAAASSRSNTNVSMLGESFKYVAPVAGALGYSAEDTAIALGLMANAGIKASQSGTSLRTALTNLVSPTDQMAGVMEELGISVTDSEGQMYSLNEVMGQLRSAFSGLDQDQQAAYASMLFGKQSMSGMLAIINTSAEDYNKLAESIYNSGGAAKQMSDTMQDNAKGGLTQLKSALEGLAIQLSEILIPIFNDIVAAVKQAVDWFAGLDKNTQKTIVTVAGLAAALGPVLMVVGTLTSGIGKLIPIIGKLIPVIKGSSVAVTALGTAIRFALGPVGLIITAIGGIVAAGKALHDHMSKESIPAIERFSEAVSEATQESVGAFMDLHDQATLALNNLAWSGRAVTQEMADSIVHTFSQMGDQILASMETKHAEELASMQEFFASAKGLTEEEQAEILANVQQSQEAQRQAVEEGQARIEEILRRASEEKRGLTQEEAAEINRIQQKMLETGIAMMSENEVEQRAILERMRANASALSARQAAEVVQNSIRQRDESIAAAEQQYNDVLKNVIRQRDELGTITAEQADKLIAEAQRQRDETIARAQEMHQSVVAEAKKQADKHVNAVNWETGEVRNRWQKLGADIKSVWDNIKKSTSNAWSNVVDTIRDAVGKVVDRIKNGLSTATDWVRSIWTRIKDVFKNAWSQMVDIGKDIIQGLINGIGSMANAVWEKAKSIAKGIGDSIKNFFGISSPSKLMMGYGEDIGEGLAIGIQRSVSDVQRQVSALNAAATANINVSGSSGSMATGGYQSADIRIYLDGRELAAQLGEPLVDQIRMMTGVRI